MLKLNNICRKYLRVFFLGCVLFQGFGQKAWGETRTDHLQGYMMLKPLPVVGRKMMQVIQGANMPQERLLFLYLFLSFLGYPEFPDFSKEDGVYIFIYDDENVVNFKWIVAAKLRENSGALERIKGLHWSTGDYKGWTLISSAKENFKLMELDKRVNTVLGQKGEEDIRVKLFLKDALKYVDAMDSGSMKEGLDHFEGEAPRGLTHRTVLEGVRMLVGNCESVDIGCNVNERMIEIDLSIEPRVGTPEEAVLSQRGSVEAYKLGQFLREGTYYSLMGSFDTEAAERYLNYFLKGLSHVMHPSDEELVEEYLSLLKSETDHSRGNFAASVDYENDGIKSVKIEAGKFTNQWFVERMEKSLPEYLVKVNYHMSPYIEIDNEFDFKFEEAVGIEKEVPIHHLFYRFTYPTCVREQEGDRFSFKDLKLKYIPRTKDEYVGILEGAYAVKGNSLESVREVVDKIVNGKIAENNLLEVLKPDENTMAIFQIHVEKYLEKVLREWMMKGDEEEHERYESIIQELEKKTLRPVVGEVKTEEKKVRMKMRVPAEVVGRVVKVI